MYVDSKNTKNLRDKMRRFGEAGVNVDDGSVDSAFYSNDEDDSDWKRWIRNARCVEEERKRQNRGC